MLKCLVQLPQQARLALGRLLGYGMYHVSAKLRHVTTVNIKLCFPNLAPLAQKKLIKDSFAATGMGLIEAGMAWFLPQARLPQPVELKGMHHIHEALIHQRGVLLLGSHLTTLEIAGRLMADYLPLAVVFQPTKHPLLNRLIHRYRQPIYQKLIPNHDMKQLLRCLKQNQIVWYAPDQAPKHPKAQFAPLFGIQALTAAATTKLATLSQAPILPVTYYRKPDYAGYCLTVHPPLKDFPSPYEQADRVRLNQWLETIIRVHPAQYFWQYKRFKPLKPGQINYYDEP